VHPPSLGRVDWFLAEQVVQCQAQARKRERIAQTVAYPSRAILDGAARPTPAQLPGKRAWYVELDGTAATASSPSPPASSPRWAGSPLRGQSAHPGVRDVRVTDTQLSAMSTSLFPDHPRLATMAPRLTLGTSVPNRIRLAQSPAIVISRLLLLWQHQSVDHRR